MEEEKRGQEVILLSFPDLSLTLLYQDALLYAQSLLKMIARCGLLHRLLCSLNMPSEMLQFPPNSPS